MNTLIQKRYVEIPGNTLHELPPLLVKASPSIKRLDRITEKAMETVRAEELLDEQVCEGFVPDSEMERRRMDLAINLVEQYLSFVRCWNWGDSILEWIRQCETTFQYSQALRGVMKPDIWPHAGRNSFVTLLCDKHVNSGNVDLRRAVGMRLTFRQPPPITCFSNQFLLYLNATVAATAYETWSQMEPPPVALLPPERFNFTIEMV